MDAVLQGYADAASADFIAAYDALSPATIYRPVIDLLPPAPARVMDVGAGTGRDAAWLAAMGHRVTAVEPVAPLRRAGMARHACERIDWRDDRLPTLAGLTPDACFDLILLSAVWHHLDRADRERAMPRLAALMERGALLILSLRHGPGAAGRPVFPCAAEETIADAHALGLLPRRRASAASVQPGNRANGVSWTWLAFTKAPAG